MSDNGSKRYYQPSMGTMFQGKGIGWDDRTGPYDSEEEVRAAMEKIAECNKTADDWDEEDDDWGVVEK